MIFNEKAHTSFSVAAKAKSFLLEAVQQQNYAGDPLLLPAEEKWLGPLHPQPRK